MKKKVLLSLITGAGIGLIAAGEYFFKYAMTPYKKKPDPKKISPKDSLYREKLWFKNFPKQEWHLNTNNLTLCAQYLDHYSNKTVILLHGFMSDSDCLLYTSPSPRD